MDNEKQQPEGETFSKHQKAIDEAINERIREEEEIDKIDNDMANRSDRRNRKADVSVKSTGGGKQSNPGD